jgi:hypothetical protein
MWAISARVFDAAGNGSANSAALTVTVDRTPPRVERLRHNARGIAVTFSEGLQVRATDLSLFNRTTGQVVDAAVLAVSYDPAATTATWTFPGLEGGFLPDGEYQVTVGGSVADLAGNTLDGNGDGVAGDTFVGAFFQLLGDATMDRVVDYNDFNVLRANFGQAGAAKPADFNGDNVVDFLDFQILERQFGRRLPQPAPAKVPATVAPARKSPPKPVPVARPPAQLSRFSTARVRVR